MGQERTPRVAVRATRGTYIHWCNDIEIDPKGRLIITGDDVFPTVAAYQPHEWLSVHLIQEPRS